MPSNIAQTPPVLAKRLGINTHKVLGWIATGQLRAINLGDGSRPRWRILADDLDAFLARRAATPAAKQTRRRRKPDPAVIEFF